jgi:PqqD family protein of HPr-rel-A system
VSVNGAGDVHTWRVATQLSWTHFDDSDDWVVYDPASDDVHLLTASAHHLWTLVSDEQPHSLEDIVAALAADLGRPPDEELTRVTRETLAMMDDVGLVRPVPR